MYYVLKKKLTVQLLWVYSCDNDLAWCNIIVQSFVQTKYLSVYLFSVSSAIQWKAIKIWSTAIITKPAMTDTSLSRSVLLATSINKNQKIGTTGPWTFFPDLRYYNVLFLPFPSPATLPISNKLILSFTPLLNLLCYFIHYNLCKSHVHQL